MLTYDQALAYLDRYANYEIDRSARYAPETFDLQRMYDLLARLGDPQQAYATVHIAGSKGKGSTAAMIDAVLRAAGYRCGLYTSPPLHTFGERMRVAGEPIAEAEVAALVEEIAPHAEAVPGITWFEIVTALAFLYFARRAVDIAVIEVGLGGRLDATNVIIPLVSVITSLSYEHTAWLGDTLAQIAFEKAGIIKPDTPVVSAPQAEEALAVIERVCAERGAPLTVIGRDWQYRPGPLRADGQAFDVRPPIGGILPARWTRFKLPLLGRHQILNGACAVAALAHLPSDRFPLTAADLVRGLATVEWPGRAEVLSRRPLVLVDGAHNGDSARCLAQTLSDWFPGQRWSIVVGTLTDKDHAAILRALASVAAHLIVTRSRSPRATDPALLAQLAAELGVPTSLAPDVPAALDAALARGDAICLTGSLSIAAEARLAWSRRQPESARSLS